MPKSEENENTLGMVDDGDHIDFTEEIERAFAVRFTDSEAERIKTIGELFDSLAVKLNALEGQRKACFSAHTFYRLKSALSEFLAKDIRPSTDLRELIDTQDARDWYTHLTNITGLRIPANCYHMLRRSRAANMAILGVCLSAALTAVYMWPVLPLALVMAITITSGIIALAPRSLKQKITIADLARETTMQNFGRLSREHGYCHTQDLWKALTHVAREAAGTGYEGPIDRETRFYYPRAA